MYAPYGGGTSRQLAALFQSLAGIPAAMAQGKFDTQTFEANEEARRLERDKFNVYRDQLTNQDRRAQEVHDIMRGEYMGGAENPDGFVEGLTPGARAMFLPDPTTNRIPVRQRPQDAASTLLATSGATLNNVNAAAKPIEIKLAEKELEGKLAGKGAWAPTNYGGAGMMNNELLAKLLFAFIGQDPRLGSVLDEKRIGAQREYMQRFTEPQVAPPPPGGLQQLWQQRR